MQILFGPAKEGRQLQRSFRTEAAWGCHRALGASESLFSLPLSVSEGAGFGGVGSSVLGFGSPNRVLGYIVL